MEACLLAAFMETPGQVVSRAYLMKTVWEADRLDDARPSMFTFAGYGANLKTPPPISNASLPTGVSAMN